MYLYAKEKACIKDIVSLRLLFTYSMDDGDNCVSKILDPTQKLEILSCIPESVDPVTYSDLLPGVDPSTTALLVTRSKMLRKSLDFVEVYSVLGRKETSTLPSATQVTRWYIQRAESIDEICGMVSYAENLLYIGMHEKNVSGLEDKYNEFNFLNMMIYNKGNLYNLNKQLVSVKDYEKNLTNYDKFKLLINKNSPDVLNQIINKGLPFIEHCDDEKVGENSILYRYLVQDLAPNHFDQCYKILASNIKTKLVGENETLVMLAIECIYTCKNFRDNEEAISKLLSSLPIQNICQDLQMEVTTIKNQVTALGLITK